MNTRQTTERQIFAHLYAKPKIYFDHSAKLTEDVFSDTEVKNYFSGMLRLLQKNSKVDAYAISREIVQPDAIQGVISIASCIEYDNSFDSLLDFVFEEAQKDKIQNLINEANAKLKSHDEAESISSFMQKGLIALMNVKAGSVKHVSEGVKEMIQNVERNMKSEGITGIKTGLKDFDDFSGGLQLTDLIILAGATSQGKTSLALSIIKHIAAYENVPCVIFSLEMNTLQLVSRISSMETEIDSKLLLRGKLSESQLMTLHSGVNKLYQSPLFIDECSNSTLSGIINSVHALVMQEGIKVAVIDYLQLVNNTSKGKNREQEVAEIARALKNTAKELNICIILLSQLSRGISARGGDKRPMLSDLRDSGQIEEAADVVMFVYRPEYYQIEIDANGNSTKGIAELIIAKGRNIGLTSIELKFDHHLTRFRNKGDMFTENYSMQPSNQFEDEPF